MAGPGGRRANPATRRRLVGVLPVVLVVGVVVTAVACSRSEKDQSGRLETVLNADSCRYDTRSDPGANHVPNASYKVNPPAGGDHDPAPAAPGIYRAGQVPPDPKMVHAMEHGYVILWYRPDIGQEVIDKLENLGDEFSNATLVAPRPSMDVPVAATAWHRRLLCKQYEEKPLRAFIEAYTDKAPEKGFIEK